MSTLAEILRTVGHKCPPRYSKASTNLSMKYPGSSGSAVNPAMAGNRRRPDGRQRSAWTPLATRI